MNNSIDNQLNSQKENQTLVNTENKTTTEKTIISIIIPFYNAESYIKRCCECLKKQDQRCEFVFVSDGSTDNTCNILNSYMNEDSRFKLYIQENQGAGIARNFGMSKAIGEYIGFLDVDDELTDNYSSTLLPIISEQNPDMVVFSHLNIRNSGTVTESIKNKVSKKISSYNNEDMASFKDLSTGHSFDLLNVCWNGLIKNEVVKQHNIRFASSRISEDNLYKLMVQLELDKFYILDEVLYKHYQISNSLENRLLQDYRSFFVNIEEELEYINSHSISTELRQEFDNHIFLLIKHVYQLVGIKERNKYLSMAKKYMTPKHFAKIRKKLLLERLCSMRNTINSKGQKVKVLMFLGLVIPIGVKKK